MLSGFYTELGTKKAIYDDVFYSDLQLKSRG